MKPGWRTTEWWISILAALGALAAGAAGVLPAEKAAYAATASGALYALSRGLAKMNAPATRGDPADPGAAKRGDAP